MIRKERAFIQIGNYILHQTDGLVLENELCRYQITDFFCEYYGVTTHQGQVLIVYEEKDGSLVLVKEIQGNFIKEQFLLSKTKKFTNKIISLEVLSGEPCVFFSAQYKQKHMILYYQQKHSVRIFDFCDQKPFQTLLRDNGEIVVLYEKRGVVGYSTLVQDSASKFIPLDAKNPIKLFEWQHTLYLLTLEQHYILYQLEPFKCYPLPLVYHRKPYLFWQGDFLYIQYRFLHKNIIYCLKNDEIVFEREED